VSGWSEGEGKDPQEFMERREVVRYLERFASHFDAPVQEEVTVLRVWQVPGGFHVETDRGSWRARRVVVATGQSQDAFVPSMAQDLAGSIHQVVPTAYRSPSQLPEGGVLVVGASATGIQLADEIHASGRPVTLAVGRHTRLPRRYRGRDILAWLHDMGLLDQRSGSVRNLDASMDQPSMQLVGSPDHRTLDLGILADRGVRLLGRARSACGRRVDFHDDLVENLAASDLKLASLRLRIDRYVRDAGLESEVEPPDEFVPVPLPSSSESLDLRAEAIRTVLWATGFRRDYPWLEVPVLDARGEIRHVDGVTAVPGLYVLGLSFLRRRSSSFLAGVGRDAEELAHHMTDDGGAAMPARAVA
jgi:putative flavoprotein involved in K+ transport